jgi:DinB superfamily
MAEAPAPGEWSAGELVDHLLRTERLWRQEVEELLRLKEAGRQPYLSRLLTDFPIPLVGRLPAPLLGLLAVPMTVFNAFLPTGLILAFLRYPTLKAKAPPAIAPRQGRPAAELKRELRSEAEATAAVFEDHPSVRFDRLIYQHPLLGIVTAVDLLRVITVHEQRHQEQLTGILRKLGVRG